MRHAGPPRRLAARRRYPSSPDRAAERVGEAVDVALRAPLGDRDQQPVLVLRVLASERIARGDPLLADPIEHLGHGRVDAHRELARHRRLVQQLHALDGRQRLARVGGAAHQQLAELDDAAPAEPGEVDRAGERVQRLGGADVVRRLLAADVLLAGLQREDEAAAPVGVGGLAGDPARHPAQVLLGGGEEAERGAAEVEAVAERLALADGDVDAALAGRAQDAERDRVDRGDAERAGLVGSASERLEVLDRAEEVRVLDEERGGLVVERRGELAGVGDAAVEPDLDDLGAEAARVGRERLAGVRVQAARDDELAPALARAEREVGGRGDRRGALVQRGVGRRAAPVSSEIAVWNSNITCRPPCETSGWYGVYGVRNSEREMIASTSAGT